MPPCVGAGKAADDGGAVVAVLVTAGEVGPGTGVVATDEVGFACAPVTAELGAHAANHTARLPPTPAMANSVLRRLRSYSVRGIESPFQSATLFSGSQLNKQRQDQIPWFSYQ